MGEAGGSRRITAQESGGSSSSSPIRVDKPTHKADGTFAPGNGLGGRKPKALEKAYLDAVRNAVPPEELESLLLEALEAARSTKSWRGIVEVVQLVMAYGAGKPAQKVIQSDGNLETLLAALSADTPLLPPAATSAPAEPARIAAGLPAGDVANVGPDVAGEDVAAGGEGEGGDPANL